MEKEVAVGMEDVPPPDGAECPNQIKELGGRGSKQTHTRTAEK